MDGHEITEHQHIHQIHQLHFADHGPRPADRWVIADHAHIKRLGPLSHLRTHIAQTDDAQCLTLELAAQLTFVRAQPRQSEHGQNIIFRQRCRHALAGIDDGDTRASSRRHVDIRRILADLADHGQFARPCQQSIVHLHHLSHDQTLVLIDDLFRRASAQLSQAVHLSAAGPHLGHCFLRNGFSNQNLHFPHLPFILLYLFLSSLDFSR